jgi:hypothetical protein
MAKKRRPEAQRPTWLVLSTVFHECPCGVDGLSRLRRQRYAFACINASIARSDHAAEHDYRIPAFNVNNLEQVQAIMSAAAQADAPVIMQASGRCS